MNIEWLKSMLDAIGVTSKLKAFSDIQTPLQALVSGDGFLAAAEKAYPEIQALRNSMGLVAFWDFSEAAGYPRLSKCGVGTFPLVDGAGSAVGQNTGYGVFSGKSASFNGSSDFLQLRSDYVGALNVALQGNAVTVISWFRRSAYQSGFLGGMWQEDTGDPRRCYGLFVDLGTYGGTNQICGHVSKTGTASPGIPFSRDYSANLTPVPTTLDRMGAFTYDGAQAISYYEGRFEPRPTYTEPGSPNGQGLTYAKNPYAFTLGLNNDTSRVSAFTVGACKLTGGWGNFFAGTMAGLMVFSRALTQAQIAEVMRLAASAGSAVISYDLLSSAVDGASVALDTLALKTHGDATATDYSAVTGTCWQATNISGNYFASIATSAGSTSARLLWDDQSFGIPLSRVKEVTFRLNNALAADSVRLAVKIGATWYATDVTYSVTGDGRTGGNWGTAETKTIPMTLSAAKWRALTFTPGVALSLAGAALTQDIPADGLLNTVGILHTGSAPAGVVRVDDIKIVRW